MGAPNVCGVVYKSHRVRLRYFFILPLALRASPPAEMSEKKELAVDVNDAKESSSSSQRSFDEKRSKNLLYKIDRNIVPFLSLLYL
jgi:hypothetical protein